MAKRIIKSSRVSKLDIINAESSQGFKSAVGEAIPVLGAAIIEDDKNGETDQFAYIFGADGSVYGGNSDTVRNSLDAFIDYMEENPDTEFTAEIISRPSSNGRDFLTVKFAEAK